MDFSTRQGETYTTENTLLYETEIKIIPNKKIPKETILFWKRKDKIILDKREKMLKQIEIKKQKINPTTPPKEYVYNILSKIYPHAKEITQEKDEYWTIYWKTGRQVKLVIVNDPLVGIGRLTIHPEMQQKEDCMQLTISYPTHKNKYLVIFNWLINALINNNTIDAKNLTNNIYQLHPKLAKPSYEWYIKQ